VIQEEGYIAPGLVMALMFFFDIQKGTDDICMVYDGTTSGLNNSLWCPWFLLPMIDSLLQCVEPGTLMCDNDIGEMVLNLMCMKTCASCVELMWEVFPQRKQGHGGN